MENALSLTRGALTWICKGRRKNIKQVPIRVRWFSKLTLGSFLNPLIGHSLTLGGLLMQHILACCIHGSLMMLTVNPFVALMFRRVSLSPDAVCILEKDMTGGEVDT